MPDSDKWGTVWFESRDPEDGGWAFYENGASLGGYEAAYEATSREAATALGVPDFILDAFEAAGGVYSGDPGLSLFCWLQEQLDHFDDGEPPEGE